MARDCNTARELQCVARELHCEALENQPYHTKNPLTCIEPVSLPACMRVRDSYEWFAAHVVCDSKVRDACIPARTTLYSVRLSLPANMRETRHVRSSLLHVRCSVLQCVAVCCSVLQCVAVENSHATHGNRATYVID